MRLSQVPGRCVTAMFGSDRSSSQSITVVCRNPGRCDRVILTSDVHWCPIAEPGGHMALGTPRGLRENVPGRGAVMKAMQVQLEWRSGARCCGSVPCG